MNAFHEMGKILLFTGLLIAVIGGAMLLLENFPALGRHIGRLPGDILIKRRNFTFYFPLATSILLSVILTLILWFLGRR